MRDFGTIGPSKQRGIAPALIAAIPALISGVSSLFGGRRANKAASAQALRQMEFQERMSSTAHQREVKDLKAAGLNPILSGTGGAGSSAPGGAQAPVRDVLTPAVNSALTTRRLGQEIRNLKATELAALAQAGYTAAQTDVIAPRATVGSLLNEGITGVRSQTPSGGLFSGFQSLLMDAISGSSASARALVRERERARLRGPRLNLKNLEIK